MVESARAEARRPVDGVQQRYGAPAEEALKTRRCERGARPERGECGARKWSITTCVQRGREGDQQIAKDAATRRARWPCA